MDTRGLFYRGTQAMTACDGTPALPLVPGLLKEIGRLWAEERARAESAETEVTRLKKELLLYKEGAEAKR